MSKLDELFREKLTDYSVAPTAGAWEKIEANLSKKNKGITWLRWAAIFLLGSLLVGTLWLRREEPAVQLTKEITPPRKNEAEIQKVIPPAVAQESTEPKKVFRQKNSPPKTLIAPVEKQDLTEEQQVVQVVVPDQKEVEPIAKDVKVAETRKPIVLTYTLEAIEPNNVVADNMETKESSLKRVVEFAKNVKTSDPIGGLRDMKGDLFALDLKKKTTDKKQ